MRRYLCFRTVFLFAAIALSSARAYSQASIVTSASPSGLSSWQHVQNLPARTKVHITTDKGGTTCKLFAVSEDTLTCATGSRSKSAGKVVQRSTIQRIKLTRYGTSTAAGTGIGFGAGVGIGFAVTDRGSWFRGWDIALLGALGGVVGATVGDGTDFTRGPTVYVRP